MQRKKVLEGNIALKAKQRFLVQGDPFINANLITLSRDPVEMNVGVIELPDQTRAPGGVKRSGEFGVSLQFGRNQDREAFRSWFNMCVDRGDAGIDPTYKRTCTIIYYRLFQGSPGNYDTGSDLPPVRATLYGVWPSAINLPEMDLSADEGDGFSILECTLQFDDSELEPQEAATA